VGPLRPGAAMEMVKMHQANGPLQGFAGEDADTTGYFANSEAKFIRQVTHKVEGDADGDGRYSIAELYDRDGDGKISMAEYAAQTNAPKGPEQFAAHSVGATEQVKKGWAVLREAQKTGDFVGTIAERVRAGREGMTFVASKGGWQPPAKSPMGAPSGWIGPATVDHNRNVKHHVADVAVAAMARSRVGATGGPLGAPGARHYG